MPGTTSFRATLSLLALCAATPALAQESPQEGSQDKAGPSDEQARQTTGFQEIIVTARRVREGAQDVPVAITAFDQESLNRRDITSGTDLQNYTPSLSVVGQVSRNQETFTIRGVGGLATQGSGGGPGVVGYFAEVPTTISGPGNFFDLGSLQVLKGPQGTLFGRNTTGGAVLLEPARPDFDGISGYGQFTYGSRDRTSGQAALNIPVIDDRLAVRVAGQFTKQDGYVSDVVTGRDYLDRDNWSVRVGVEFRPTDTIRSYTAFNYVEFNENAGGEVLLAVNPDSTYAPLLLPLLAAQQSRDPYHVSLSTPTRDVAKRLLVLNNTEWDVSPTITLKNVISYAHDRATLASDRDASPLPISDLLGGLPGSYNNNVARFTEEFQARYDDGILSVQGGLFYLDESTPDPLTFSTRNPLQVGIVTGGPIILPGPPFLLPLRSIQDKAEIDATSKAVYVQAGYHVVPEVEITAGFRWTWDEYGGSIRQFLDPASFEGLENILGPVGAGLRAAGANLCLYDAIQGDFRYYPDCSYPSFGDESDGPSWQFGAAWTVDPSTLLYAVSRRGYKSGGYNPFVTLVSPAGEDDPLFAYKPEKVTDVEIGIKKDWTFGQARARTNISAFYMWYNDIQVVQRQALRGIDLTTNAEAARVRGFEFDGMISPIRELVLSATYSYNDAEYTDYVTLPVPAVNGGAALPSVDRSGTPFVYVPEHKFTLGGVLTLPFPNSLTDFRVSANYTWQSSQRVSIDPQPFDTIPTYGLLNLSAEIANIGDSGIDLSVFGTNVFDKRYPVAVNPGYLSSGFTNAIYGAPAEYGIRARVSFK